MRMRHLAGSFCNTLRNQSAETYRESFDYNSCSVHCCRDPLGTLKFCRLSGVPWPLASVRLFLQPYGVEPCSSAYCGVNLILNKQVSRIYGLKHYKYFLVLNVLQTPSFERPHRHVAIAAKHALLSRSATAGRDCLRPLHENILYASLALLLLVVWDIVHMSSALARLLVRNEYTAA